MPRDKETPRDRLRKISLLQWGLICLGASGFSSAILLAQSPARNRAEAAGRATGILIFVVAGVVLIVMHFVRKGRTRPAAPQTAGSRPKPAGGGRPNAPPRRPGPRRPQ